MQDQLLKRIRIGVWVCLICFVAIGCMGTYKTIGLTEEQAAEEVAKDQAEIVTTIGEGREVFWQTVSAAIAGVGVVVSTLLGKWLATERKMTAAMIAGVEKVNDGNAKKAIAVESSQRGVGVPLADRVRKQT